MISDKGQPFQKNLNFFPPSSPSEQGRQSTQVCANEYDRLYCTKCIFITPNKTGYRENLIGDFHSKGKMHLSEGNSVVYNGQQGPFVSLSQSSCERHHDSQSNYSHFIPPQLFKSQILQSVIIAILNSIQECSSIFLTQYFEFVQIRTGLQEVTLIISCALLQISIKVF